MPPVTATAVELPDGETVHYRRRAGGEIPVVLERTDGRFDLIAMDMRGFGDSSYRQPVDSLADLAADVRRFADAIDRDAFHLWGWSLGAGVATRVAADVPDRVGRLVLMAPPGTQGTPSRSLPCCGRSKRATRR